MSSKLITVWNPSRSEGEHVGDRKMSLDNGIYALEKNGDKNSSDKCDLSSVRQGRYKEKAFWKYFNISVVKWDGAYPRTAQKLSLIHI